MRAKLMAAATAAPRPLGTGYQAYECNWGAAACKYSARPGLWLNGPDRIRCVVASERVSDEDTWNTSLAVAKAIESSHNDAFGSMCDAIDCGEVDVALVDCYLPVITRPNRRCVHCDHHTSRASIMTLWLDAAYGYGDVKRNWYTNWTQLLYRFFWRVLVPCGFAARFNEPVDCRGRTALAYAIQTEPRLFAPDPTKFLFCPATIILDCVPQDSGFDVGPPTQFPAQPDAQSQEITRVMDACARATERMRTRDAFIVAQLNVLLLCGRSRIPDRGWIKTLTPAQIVLMFL